MPGVGGFLFKPLTLAVAFAMIASFVLSWTFVPALCSKLLRGHGQHGHARRPTRGRSRRASSRAVYGRISGAIDFVGRGYAALLAVALRHRSLVLARRRACCSPRRWCWPGASARSSSPRWTPGRSRIQVRGPSNLRLDATERRIIDVEKSIAEDDPAARAADDRLRDRAEHRLVGGVHRERRPAGRRHPPATHAGADEDGPGVRRSSSGTQLAADPRFADLEFSFDTGGMVSAALNFGARRRSTSRSTGGTPEQKFEVGRRRSSELVADVPRGGRRARPAAERRPVPDARREPREGGRAVGLSARDVVMQVVTAMNSSIALTRNFWIDPKSGNQYFVAVQYPDNPNLKIEDLQNVFATGTNQRRRSSSAAWSTSARRPSRSSSTTRPEAGRGRAGEHREPRHRQRGRGHRQAAQGSGTAQGDEGRAARRVRPDEGVVRQPGGRAGPGLGPGLPADGPAVPVVREAAHHHVDGAARADRRARHALGRPARR